MQYILTCPNGKQIDMTSDVLKQLKGEITREDVTNKIHYTILKVIIYSYITLASLGIIGLIFNFATGDLNADFGMF
jgi:hypothetical protein